MSTLDAVLLVAAGVGAGLMNAVAGAGSLVIFPTLVALGYSPLTANVTNTVGLIPASISAAIGYRRQLRGQGARLRRLAPATVLGALVGAGLLLALPPAAFELAAPLLVLVAVSLVVLQPVLRSWAARRRAARPRNSRFVSVVRLSTLVAVWGTGVYGGYFGAAQGVVLIGVLGLDPSSDIQVVNGLKNVLVGLANGVAGVVFLTIADVDVVAALLLLAGSAAGGLIGARVALRLPEALLRGLVIAVGLVAVVVLLRQ